MEEDPLEIPMACQQGPAADKGQQGERASTPQPDSGCYSIDHSSSDLSCDLAQNGGSTFKGGTANGGMGEEHHSDNIAVKKSEAVVNEQPPTQRTCSEVDDNTPTFPVSGPPVTDSEDGTGKHLSKAHDARPRQGSRDETSYQDSQHNATSESSRLSNDKTVSLKTDLSKLHCRTLAIQCKLKAMEDSLHRRRYDLVHKGQDVDAAALQTLLLETCEEISEDRESLLNINAEMTQSVNCSSSAPSISPDSKDLKGIPTNTSTSTASSESNIPSVAGDQHSNTDMQDLEPTSDSTEKNARCSESVLNDGNTAVILIGRDDGTESTVLGSRDAEGCNSGQEESDITGKNKPDLQVKTEGLVEDHGQMQCSDSQRQEGEECIEPLKGQPGASANSNDPSESVTERKRKSEDQGQKELPAEEQNRKKLTGDKVQKRETSNNEVTNGKLEDTKKDRILPPNLQGRGQAKDKSSISTASDSLVSKELSEKRAQNVAVPNPVKEDQHKCQKKGGEASNHLGKKAESENPIKNGSLPNLVQKARNKTRVKSNAMVETGLPEGPAENEVLANKSEKERKSEGPLKASGADTTEVKRRPSGDLSESGTLFKNLVKKGPSERKDKAVVPFRSPDERGQAENPCDNDIPPKEPQWEEGAGNMRQKGNLLESKPKNGKTPKKRKVGKQEQKSDPTGSHLLKSEQVEKELLCNTPKKQKKIRLVPKKEPSDSMVQEDVPEGSPVFDNQLAQQKKQSCITGRPLAVDCPGNTGKEKEKTKESCAMENREQDKVIITKEHDMSHTLPKERHAQDHAMPDDQEDITALKKVWGPATLPQNGEGTTAEKETFIKTEEKESCAVKGRELVCSKKCGLNLKAASKIKDEKLDVSASKGHPLIVQIRGDSSLCGGDQGLLPAKKVSVKSWMGRKISFILTLVMGLYSFLTSWSHNEEPPDAKPYRKTDASRIGPDHVVQVYNVQRQGEEIPEDSDAHSDNEEDQDDYNPPEWLAQEDVDEDELYSDDPTDIPEASAAVPAGPFPCTESPEGGQIAVGGGGHTHHLNSQELSTNHQQTSGHSSPHLQTAPRQDAHNVSADTHTLEAEIQHYRETERGISVTVLDIGGQVLSQSRVYTPTAVQEHVLMHTAFRAFAAYPMHGFTVKWPGGRAIPLGTSLDPRTAQNIILQLYHADEGDDTWRWRIIEISVGGRYTFIVEVNIHHGPDQTEQDCDRELEQGQPEEKVQERYDRGPGYFCVICLDDEVDLAVEISCKHSFHQKCLNKWLLQEKTCPICRKHLDPRNGS